MRQPWLLPLRGRSNSRASVAVLDLCLEPSHPASYRFNVRGPSTSWPSALLAYAAAAQMKAIRC